MFSGGDKILVRQEKATADYVLQQIDPALHIPNVVREVNDDEKSVDESLHPKSPQVVADSFEKMDPDGNQIIEGVDDSDYSDSEANNFQPQDHTEQQDDLQNLLENVAHDATVMGKFWNHASDMEIDSPTQDQGFNVVLTKSQKKKLKQKKNSGNTIQYITRSRVGYANLA